MPGRRAMPAAAAACSLPGLACLLLLLSCAWAAQELGGKPSGVDLTKATLNQTLAQLPADAYVLMEFYATWCPACRAFKADYDKVARFLQSQPNGPSKVSAYRLDCAVDQDVCGSYKVQAYPSMYAGRAEDMMAADLSKLGKFDYGKYSRNAVGVVKFVADHFKLNDLVFVDVPEPTPVAKGTSKWVAADIQWTEQDVQLATNELMSQITASKALHSSTEQRAALVDLLKLFEGFHPSDTCRTGATEALQQLNKLWPADKPEPVSELKSLNVCGDCAGHDSCSGGMDAVEAMMAKPAVSSSTSSSATRAPPAYLACKGSKPDSRGYTCGLWLLFHAIAGRLPDDAGATYIKAMQGFGHQFFQCAVCKKHFEKCVDSAEAAAVRTRRDAVLWTWRIHNEVNSRLEVIEQKYGHSSTGDPEWPKMQWPVLEACPQCRLPGSKKPHSDERGGGDGGRRTGEAAVRPQDAVQWNEEEVFRYLMKWYGGKPGDGGKVFFERLADGSAGAAAAGPATGADGLPLAPGGGSSAALYGSGSSVAASGMRGVLLLAVVASLVFYMLYGRSQRRRHALKGPAAAQRLLHGKGHSTGAAANGAEAWGGPRHGTRKISTG